ncbi:MAG TPA: DUF5304 family protein [Nocardioides sp.]|uniref:DUF5304 family protein n=1 Tax=Nocardioides sp. TaxID=35761 RepID=UPI002ED8FAB4
MTHDQHGHDPVGSAAEEAVKLFGALSDWARDHTPRVDEHLATGAQECTYCPLCRAVHIVREASPEVRLHLAEAATALMQAGAAVVAAASSSGWASSTRRSDSVQHIDLDDDRPWDQHGPWPGGPETGEDTE